jgi:hypothetical protein
METQRNTRFGFWHGVLLTVLVIFVAAVILFPVFSRARRASYPSSARYDRISAKLRLSRAPESASQDAGYTAGAGEAQAASWANSLTPATSRMLITTADLSMEVRDAKKTHDEIAGIASKAGGYVTGSSLTGEESGAVTMRVPAARYASALAEVSKLGKVLSKQEKGEDVTEEFVDLQSRIRNLKREEEAFLLVLRKAKRVPDILQVERELSRVRGEIEQAVGRAKYLENQVALSTINVSFNEPVPVVTQAVNWNVTQTALRCLHSLGEVFRVISSLLIWLVVFIPLWALIGLVWYAVRRLMRSRSA